MLSWHNHLHRALQDVQRRVALAQLVVDADQRGHLSRGVGTRHYRLYLPARHSKPFRGCKCCGSYHGRLMAQRLDGPERARRRLQVALVHVKLRQRA
jgi:hypothetical protein